MMFRPALMMMSSVLVLMSGFSTAASAQDAAPAAAAPVAPAITFTGGASSISETHGDWTMICGVQGKKVCVITQTLGDSQSGQRIVTVEFEAAGDGVEGTLMMPFGLRLSEGVRTQIGGVTVGKTAPFASCYDRGCMAAFSMDGEVTNLLKRGQDLNLIAIADDSGENVQVKASLAGFTSALARSIELAK